MSWSLFNFGVAVRVDWIKFDVWLKQAFFQLFKLTQTVITFGSCQAPEVWLRAELLQSFKALDFLLKKEYRFDFSLQFQI